MHLRHKELPRQAELISFISQHEAIAVSVALLQPFTASGGSACKGPAGFSMSCTFCS